MLLWTRRRYCFLLCLSSDLGGVWCFLRCLRSDLGGVWLFRIHCRGAAFLACPGYVAPCFWSMYWGVPEVLFWTRRMYCFLRRPSSDLGGVWLFRIPCRGAAFSACPGQVAPCFWSMYWGSFLLLRGFQRCCFGPAECTVFCCA